MKFEPGDIVEFYNQGTIDDDVLKKYDFKVGDLAKVISCVTYWTIVKFLKNEEAPQISFKEERFRPVGFLHRLKALKEA